jgi:hypothetical protein
VAALRDLRFFRGPGAYRTWLDSMTIPGDGRREPRPFDAPDSPTERYRCVVAEFAAQKRQSDYP